MEGVRQDDGGGGRVTLKGRQMAEAQTETEWLGKGEGSDPRPSLGFKLNRSLPCLDLGHQGSSSHATTASLRQADSWERPRGLTLSPRGFLSNLWRSGSDGAI